MQLDQDGGLPELDRAALQRAQYEFPYHWIPRLDCRELKSFTATMEWSLEYWACLHECTRTVSRLQVASVLDVGCGDGRFLSVVSGSCPHTRLVGIDPDERAIRLAEAMCSSGVSFVCGRMSEVSDRYELITMIEVYEHVPPSECPRLLSDARDRLSPGGHLLLTVPHENLPTSEKHYRHFSSESIARELRAAGLKIVEMGFLHDIGLVQRTLRRLVCNRLYVLRHERLVAATSRIYKRYFMRCKESQCAHIAVLVRVEDRCR